MVVRNVLAMSSRSDWWTVWAGHWSRTAFEVVYAVGDIKTVVRAACVNVTAVIKTVAWRTVGTQWQGAPLKEVYAVGDIEAVIAIAAVDIADHVIASSNRAWLRIVA